MRWPASAATVTAAAVKMPDGRGVALEPLARSAQRTGRERLGVAPGDDDSMWLLIESQPLAHLCASGRGQEISHHWYHMLTCVGV